ncbi:MAG: glycosyltransferase family 2 protein [Bacteroidales bacterium]|nr:glycosyltransferase family 2 protein [Bacteroidales bacterium]
MISVVIPLYNKEKAIESTIRSVLAQSYKDFEVVVVNDGSTDKSSEVVLQLVEEDNRVRLLEQKNAGVSAARNKGIFEAKGEFIAFLDGDDLWDKTYLEELDKLIKDFPDAAIYGLGSAPMTRGVRGFDCERKLPKGFRGIVENVWRNYPYYWTGSSSSSKERLLSLNGFDARMTHGEDLDMWWRLLLSGDGVFYNKILAYYVQDSENRAMNRVIPLEKHLPFYMDKYAEARGVDQAFRKFFDEEMARRLFPYLFDKNYKKEAKRLLGKVDWSLQKKSLYWRMRFPRLYQAYMRLKKTAE